MTHGVTRAETTWIMVGPQRLNTEVGCAHEIAMKGIWVIDIKRALSIE